MNLEDVVVGQKLVYAYYSKWENQKNFKFAEVTKVTPRQLVLNTDERVNKDTGFVFGNKDVRYQVVTEEIRNEASVIRRLNKVRSEINAIMKNNWTAKYSVETLEAILALLTQVKP